MLQNLSSAAVVIDALRVDPFKHKKHMFEMKNTKENQFGGYKSFKQLLAYIAIVEK